MAKVIKKGKKVTAKKSAVKKVAEKKVTAKAVSKRASKSGKFASIKLFMVHLWSDELCQCRIGLGRGVSFHNRR